MIKTLMKSVRSYKKASLLSPFFVTLEVILECIIPFLMAKLIDEMTGESFEPILKYGIPLILMAMISLVCGYLAGRYASTASCGYAKNLRHDIYYSLQDFSFSDVDKFSSSSLITRLTTDVMNVQMAYQMLIRGAIRSPLMIIFSFVMSFSINWKLALIFLAILPVLAIALGLIIWKVFPMYEKVFKKYDNLNNSVQENLSGIRVVKSFVREDFEKKKFNKASSDVKNDFTVAEKILALNNPIMSFCIYSAILLVSFFGTTLIVSSASTEFTTGELASLINYGVQILMSLMMLSMVFVMIIMAAESSRRIAEVLEQKPTLIGKEGGETELADGSVVFKNVDFKYSERAEKYALDGVDLEIASGETVGILGGTGASKTTLVQLIPRLYDATDGEVLVGGKDVKDYDLKSLRESVAVVLQKNLLFAGTIKENLRWGNPNATDEELVRACVLAQADDFIRQFPDGYDHYIEQGGTNVSGGQKQRLCIARALLKKPKILILDDSTSAVDTKTDAMIRKAFQEEIPETTKIIIAQRVASVEEADKIVVLDEGKIIAIGKHSDLLEQSPVYREVYYSQNSGNAFGNAGAELEENTAEKEASEQSRQNQNPTASAASEIVEKLENAPEGGNV